MASCRPIREAHDALIVKGSSPQQYKILKDYKGTYIEKDVQKEEKMLYPIFRPFEPVRPSSRRKLNIDPELHFDPYNDSLMDYPSIIGNKLKKSWKQYNRLISLHIPSCPNNCWHCYVPKELYENAVGRSEDIAAEDIVDRFLEQRNSDANQGKYSNVLRITGGEPFLLPELIRDCLRHIKAEKKDNEIFLWTETNLLPFIGENGKAFMDEEKNMDILSELRSYNNFAVHPCFHGLSEEEFSAITKNGCGISLSQQLGAVERLLKAGIDIYPSFGSNVCDPSNAENLFKGLRDLHPQLPLKVALIEYNLGYESVPKRLKGEERKVNIYSRFINLRIWNQLLLSECGIGYAILPRHLVSLERCGVAETMARKDLRTVDQVKGVGKEVIFLFKSSFRDHYHREILDMLALPNGHIYDAEYEKRWIPDDLLFHMRQFPQSYKGKQVIWAYVDMERRTSLPIRSAYIEELCPSEDIVKIKVKLDKYICWKRTIRAADETTRLFSRYFGENTIPPGGKFILPGEDTIFEEIELSGGMCDSEESKSPSQNIHHLLPYKKMKKSLFYWITTHGLEQMNEGKADRATVCEVRGGKSFKINVGYFLPNYEEFDEHNSEERTIYCQSTSANIKPVGEAKIVLTKYGSEEIEFTTNKTVAKEIVTLTFWSKHNEFYAAKPTLKVRLLPPSKVKAGLFSLLGSLLFVLATGGLAIAGQTYDKKSSIWTTFWESIGIFFAGVKAGNIVLNALFFLVLAGIFFLLFILFPRGLPFKKGD
jgi:uncharacterized Fe-S cluster-containing radical SAM superfamily protein